MSCTHFCLLALLVGTPFGPSDATDPPDPGTAKTEITIVVSPSGRITTTIESTPSGDPARGGVDAVAAFDDTRSGPGASSANGKPDDPVDASRTLANRRPRRPGIPGRQQAWFVWTADRPGRVGPGDIKRVTVHVEDDSPGDCPSSDPRKPCAIASIWIYGEEESESGNYRLKLQEKYTKIQIHPVRDRGPMRSLAFRAELPVRGPDGQEDPDAGTRSFLITGSHRGAANRLDQRAVRITTYTRATRNGLTDEQRQDLIKRLLDEPGGGERSDGLKQLQELLKKLNRFNLYGGDCVEAPDDAYYDEDEYTENDYDYYDDPDEGYPYEEYEYEEEP